MGWQPSDKEVQAMLAAAGDKRAEYCMKHIADEGKLWGLRRPDGWVIGGDHSGKECFPVWPHEIYARACATDDWKDSAPQPIEIDTWLARWLPGLKRDNRQVAVFPLPNNQGVIMEPDEMEQALQLEISKFE